MASAERFLVHSAVQQDFEVDAITAVGRPVKAMVRGLVVELTPVGHTHGTMTRRYVPDSDGELEELIAKYKPGAWIEVTTSLSEEQPKPKEERPPDVRELVAEPAPEPVASHAPESPNIRVNTDSSVAARSVPPPPQQ